MLRLQSSQRHARHSTQPLRPPSVDRSIGQAAAPLTALALIHTAGPMRRHNSIDRISVSSQSCYDVTPSRRQKDFRSPRGDVAEQRDSAVMGDVWNWKGSRCVRWPDSGSTAVALAQRPDDEFELASGLCPRCTRELKTEMAHGQREDTATARPLSTADIQQCTGTAPRSVLHIQQ